MLGELIVQEDIRLPALIDRARHRLAEARTSAEVLEARAAAKAALHYAKLQQAAIETQADCLSMIKRAEIRMADEIDAAQQRGEVARHNAGGANLPNGARTAGTVPATFGELGISSQRVAEWRELRDAGEHVIDEAIQAALDEGRAPTNADVDGAVKARHHRTRFTGENEWYTPAEYVEAARACLGAIDLDPATAPVAQQTVRATRFFTRDNDGLRHEWRGRIWLNPPYAQPDIARFVEKLLAELAAGRAMQAILLTHNYTDTSWFHAAAEGCAAICFTRGRIRFVSPTGGIAAPTQGQAFFYFGPRRRPVPRNLRQLRVHPMTQANGYNPLRWDCVRRGCFNLKRRPKIEVFADCFPGRINFGDVDGIVEINGNALLLEWKSEAHELPTGQRILYERLTHSGLCSAMIVVGDAETMIAVATSIFDRGIKYPARGHERADLQLIKHRLAAWSRWAARHPVMGTLQRESR